MVAIETMNGTSDSDAERPAKLTTLIEVWDIEKTMLIEEFGTRRVAANSDAVEELQPVTADDAEPSPANAIAAMVQARQEGTNQYDFAPARRRGSIQAGRSSMDGALPTPPPPLPDIRSFVVGTDLAGYATMPRSAMADHIDSSSSSRSSRGYMISGSEDQRLRLWDFGKVERSTVLSGPGIDGERASYR